MIDFWVAVVVAVASAVCYGGGAVGQRRVAERMGGAPSLRVLPTLLRNRLWWAAITLNGAGAILHVAALAYGTLIVVQPLGTLALVFALPWAAGLAARRVSAREWRGAILTVLALGVMLGAAASTADGTPLGNRTTVLVMAVTLAVLAALLLPCVVLRGSAWRSQLTAAAAGIVFGVASALTKTVTEEFLDHGPAGLWHLAVPGIAVLGVAGVLLSQAAYHGVTVGAPLATMTLTNPLAAVLVGLVFMEEAYLGGVWGAAVAAVAALVAVRGVVLLTVTVTDPPAVDTTPVPAGASAGPSTTGGARDR